MIVQIKITSGMIDFSDNEIIACMNIESYRIIRKFINLIDFNDIISIKDEKDIYKINFETMEE